MYVWYIYLHLVHLYAYVDPMATIAVPISLHDL